jgi:Zn-dependent peptidase ImmA (M78 family)
MMNPNPSQPFFDLSSRISRELEEQAISKLALTGRTSRIVKEEVFHILLSVSTFIQFPIRDDELCAFVCRKGNKIFSFVNSNIPYEKQIFAAAHELYHIWYDEEVLADGELLRENVLETELERGNIDEREAKANRFAAMFLVPTDVLRKELDNLRIKPTDIREDLIVVLMDLFGVPYKTMVRRLHEIDFIDRDKCAKLLLIPDRDESTGIRLLQRRLQIGEELQRGTHTIRFDGLIDRVITAYERKKIDEKKMQYLLALAHKQPQDFGIVMSQNFPTEEEIRQQLENDED